MGRKRSVGNERLGDYVQRRSGGVLELRFPVPEDVAYGFPDQTGRPRKQIIRSLGTSDVKLANARADILRTELRSKIATLRSSRSALSLDDYLRELLDSEIAHFRNEHKAMSREMLQRPSRREGIEALGSSRRQSQADALLSIDEPERRAVASWAAEAYFQRLGRQPMDQDEFNGVSERCASVLVDSIIAVNDIVAGKAAFPESTPPKHFERLAPVSERAQLPISRYFKDVYLPALMRKGTVRGENTISGKATAVRLFTEIVGDRTVAEVTKADLWTFHDELLRLPNPRTLSGAARSLPAPEQIELLSQGLLIANTLNPKTVNKHLTGIKTILDFAERRRDIDTAPTQGVRAELPEEDETGRAFTTAELNRIFAQPLFAGCSEGLMPGGLFKAGSVLVRDDRFWIPLVLLFTGARSAEVVGLGTNEVVIDHEVPHFVFERTEVRGIKNKQSRRMVPVHQTLLDLGFAEFARDTARQVGGRFFPMADQLYFTEGATGTTRRKSLSNSLIMRQFNRTILKAADAKANGGSIKCFRNTFEQESTARIPSDEIRRRLTGRDLGSTVQIYTQNIPTDEAKRTVQLRTLKGEIDRIVYEGVSFAHLYAGRRGPVAA